ncbi:hypothetical protein CGCSCA4_v008998 [Colletotrichum siamense]|uniref:Uncharacterized protein n=1 Tax=Colletotrichum siamense TaxID=690259 RepID=A0A9P5EHH6_COLSI|nr:hypothetical protein CGCSCA2_v014933 [Colletotrichum siamense]KAF4841992.1 hypothetical protein CGCSCA4_v008998 [Colletotrichum siamense]
MGRAPRCRTFHSAPLTEDLGGTLQTVVYGHDWHHVPSRPCLLGAIVTTLQHDSITVRVFDKYSRRTGVPAASYLTLPQAHRPPLNIDHHASLFVVNQEDQVTSTASVRAAKPKILSIFVGYCPFLLLLSRRAIHRSLQASALWQTPQDARCQMPSSPRMAVRRGLQLAFQVYQDNDDAVDICVSPAATVQPQPPVDSVPKQRHLLASVSLPPH